jgi:hypothetical protein
LFQHRRLMVFSQLSLTLTLSRWAREQPLAATGFPSVIHAAGSGAFAKARRTFLPRPAGEGRGEGERIQTPNRRPQCF